MILGDDDLKARPRLRPVANRFTHENHCIQYIGWSRLGVGAIATFLLILAVLGIKCIFAQNFTNDDKQNVYDD